MQHADLRADRDSRTYRPRHRRRSLAWVLLVIASLRNFTSLAFENADQIAAWAKSFGKKITGVYITHGHSEDWLGIARLLQHFPEGRGYAAPEVAARAAWGGGVQQDEPVLDAAVVAGAHFLGTGRS